MTIRRGQGAGTDELVRFAVIGQGYFAQSAIPPAFASARSCQLAAICINATRYLLQDEPIEVTAFAASKPGDARFQEVDEQVSATLHFPDERLAQLMCSFGEASVRSGAACASTASNPRAAHR